MGGIYFDIRLVTLLMMFVGIPWFLCRHWKEYKKEGNLAFSFFVMAMVLCEIGIYIAIGALLNITEMQVYWWGIFWGMGSISKGISSLVLSKHEDQHRWHNKRKEGVIAIICGVILVGTGISLMI